MNAELLNSAVTFARGFRAAGVNCGIRKDKFDLALIAADMPASAAGVFTTNRCCAAPVQLSKKHLAAGVCRAILVNAGNANAATGIAGDAAALRCAKALAQRLRCPVTEIAVASTGKIGIPLPADKICAGLDTLIARLSVTGGADAAQAILTTDTFAKERALEIRVDGKPVRIGGMAKGAGMIMPNLATMLAFITTDAAVAPATLRRLLARAAGVSFNRVTVDSDTSTNDSLFMLASGAAGVRVTSRNERVFYRALESVCVALAQLLARDGEGATKFVSITAAGCRTTAEADAIARTVANSPLVKTALFGSNPNWGRILAAAGRAGVAFDPATVNVQVNGVLIVKAGQGAASDPARVQAAFSQHDLDIQILLRKGKASATIWTCDLSHQYIDINVDYN